MSPSVYVIAGPNGAGKTTFAEVFLPQYADCKFFVNADLIARGMAPFSPESANFQAGRLMLQQIRALERRKVDFGFETTLAGRAHVRLIQDLKAEGYAIHIFFLWLATVDLALARIGNRVAEGGHDVPERVVRRRFERSIRNFVRHYRPLADAWSLFDNSGEIPALIGFEEGGEQRIIDARLYGELIDRYKVL